MGAMDAIAAPHAPARGLGADLPLAGAGERRDAGRDRRLGRHRPAHRLGARLRALAGMPGGRSVPEDRLPLLRRVLEPDRSPASRSSCTLATFLGSLLAPGARAHGSAGWPAAAFFGTLPAGAARRDHRPLQAEPLARRHPLPALDRRARRSACSSRSRRGTSAANRVPAESGSSRRWSVAPAPLCSSRATLATAAGPHSGGVKVPRVWRLEPAVCAARPRDRGVRPHVPRAPGVARAPAAAATSAARSSCSGCSSSR